MDPMLPRAMYLLQFNAPRYERDFDGYKAFDEWGVDLEMQGFHNEVELRAYVAEKEREHHRRREVGHRFNGYAARKDALGELEAVKDSYDEGACAPEGWLVNVWKLGEIEAYVALSAEVTIARTLAEVDVNHMVAAHTRKRAEDDWKADKAKHDRDVATYKRLKRQFEGRSE